MQSCSIVVVVVAVVDSYAIMLNCWLVEPSERPDFVTLVRDFDGMVTQSVTVVCPLFNLIQSYIEL